MKKKANLSYKDPNAKAMWGRTRSSTFKDKTKYTRKAKHKQRDF